MLGNASADYWGEGEENADFNNIITSSFCPSASEDDLVRFQTHGMQ